MPSVVKLINLYSPCTIPNQKVHQRMKLNAFSVKPLTKNPAISCIEKLPDLGSIVSADPVALPTILTLLFVIAVLGPNKDVSGLAGGEGEIKYLLGEPLALMARTRMLVNRTETM